MVTRCIVTMLLLIGTLSLSAQGLKLFSPEVRDAASYHQLVVMDFLERYFTDLPQQKRTTIETKMADDKVFFRKGSLSDLRQIADTTGARKSSSANMALNIGLVDRHYEVTWSIGTEPFIQLVFPAQYDLLLGMSQEEAKNRFRETVIAAPNVKAGSVPARMTQQDDGVYVSKSEQMELESLSDAIYHNKVREDYQPVWDTAHIDYSAANLFHGLIANADYRMYVEQSVYGMKTINYTLSLQQWLNYCAQLGMKVFFAVEEQRQDGMLAIVMTQCSELGFNHLLSVVIPDKFVTDKNTVLKVRLTPYIPTHNVKNLYKQETGNHKKKIWQ